MGGRVNPKRNQRPGGIGLVRPVIDYQPLVQPPQQIDPAPRCIHRHPHFLSEVGIDQLLARPLRQQCREGLQRRQFLQLRDLPHILLKKLLVPQRAPAVRETRLAAHGPARPAPSDAGPPRHSTDASETGAAQARSLGVTLVTANAREFKRVKGLKVLAWK